MWTPQMRRILASSFVGSAIEFYDFILYATASSIVFAKLYFSGLGPGLSLVASFSTLAAGYLARPLGGVVFGHFGDRVGRKRALVISMIIMGSVTVLIGLMPPTSSIGMVAPISLFVLRIAQGFAVGGEWGGAALMALEHAPANRRGLAAAFANAGGPAGALLATLTLSLTAYLSGPAFGTWGWRIPFLLSAVLIAVGLVIRLRVSETPAFKLLEQKHQTQKVPLLSVLKNYKRQVLIALLATSTIYITQGLTTVWGVSVAIEAGEDKSAVLNWKAVGALTTFVITFICARLSDRIGRRKALIGAHIVAVLAAFPLVQLIMAGELDKYAIAIILGNGVVQGLCFGPIAAFVTELFPARIRYTGASLGYQVAAALGAGLSPVMASALILVPGGTGPMLIGAVWAGFAVLGLIAVAVSRPAAEVEVPSEGSAGTQVGVGVPGAKRVTR